MKKHPLTWIFSSRTLALLAAALALLSASHCYAAPGQDASDLATQFERLSKAALMAGRGSPEGFKQVRESREAFTAKLRALRSGRHFGLCSPTGFSDATTARLNQVAAVWEQIDQAAGRLLDGEEGMRQIRAAVQQINTSEKPMLELTEQISAMKLVNQRSPRAIAVSQMLVIVQMRLVRNANAMLSDEVIDPETAFLLGKDTNTFRDLGRGLQSGSDALRLEASEGEELAKLTDLAARFEVERQASAMISGNLQRLVMFKSAVQLIVGGGEGFFQSLLDLEKQIGASSIC